MAQTFAVIAQGEGFTWYYTEGDGARVRYGITHTPDDKWKEIGEPLPTSATSHPWRGVGRSRTAGYD